MSTVHPVYRRAARVLLLASLTTISALVAVSPAQARQRHTTTTGPQGKAWQHDVARTPGHVSSSTTGPNAQSSQRVLDRSATGAQATVTGPQGQTLTRDTQRDASGSQTTVTGPNGQTTTRTTTRTQQP